jgi:ABC-type polar amino acid transport system ATPase subunit
VVVTHDLGCAFAVSDRIAFLHQGRILEIAAPENFRTASERSSLTCRDCARAPRSASLA